MEDMMKEVTESCEQAAEVVEEVTIEALGHSYGSPTTVGATCTVNGSTTSTCLVCGSKSVSPIAATGHQLAGEGEHIDFVLDDSQNLIGVTCVRKCGTCSENVATPYSVKTVEEMTPDGMLLVTYYCNGCGMQIPW